MSTRILTLFLSICFAAFGQTFTASLTGIVTDPGAGAVAGATAKMRNTSTSEERTATASEEGRLVGTSNWETSDAGSPITIPSWP